MISGILTKLEQTKAVRRFENWAIQEKSVQKNAKKPITNYSELQRFYPTAFMLITIGAQTGVIYDTKDMPKKRRIPLALNNIINCSISLLGGFILAKHSVKLVNKFVDHAKILYSKKTEKEKTILINGITTAIPFLISALLFKYAGQVIATPITDKVNKFLVKKGFIDYSKD
jgi:hypothetical protein